MSRRIDDEIRSLCKDLLAGKDDEAQIRRLKELRRAMHLHIERLRARAADYPVIVERRQHQGIPPPEASGD